MSGITLTLDGIEPLLARLVDEAVEQKIAALKDDRPMDSKEAAAYLGVARRRIHDLCNEGRLPRRSDGPGHKLWLLRSDLDAYIEGKSNYPNGGARS